MPDPNSADVKPRAIIIRLSDETQGYIEEAASMARTGPEAWVIMLIDAELRNLGLL